MIGTTQIRIISASGVSCATALKRLTSTRLQAEVRKALMEKDPEQVYGQLNDIALKASVGGKLSAGSIAALRSLQGAYHAVLDAWAATPSKKHREEMNALFHAELGIGRKKPKKRL